MNIFINASQALNSSISQDPLISNRKDLSFSPYNSINLLELLRSATSISYDGFEITAFIDNTKNSYITTIGTVSSDYIDSNYGLSKEIISIITNNYNQNNSKKPCFITTTNSDNLKFLMVFFPHYTKSHETYFLVTGFSYDSIFASSSPNFNKNGVTIINMLDDFSIFSKDLSEKQLTSIKNRKTPFMYHLVHEYYALLNITGKLKFTYFSNSFYYYLTILQYIPLLLIFTFLIVLSMFVISKQISKRLYSPLNNNIKFKTKKQMTMNSISLNHIFRSLSLQKTLWSVQINHNNKLFLKNFYPTFQKTYYRHRK